MPVKIKIEVIAQLGQAPDAVLAVTPPSKAKNVLCKGRTFHGTELHWRALKIAAKMIPTGVFDAELSARWGCIVACTPEFSDWWRAREDRPAGLFLEVEI